MVFSRWQRGDVLLIDNFSTSHGRQPTYDKGRKVAVAWSDPLKKADEVVSLEPVLVEEKEVVQQSFCMENPQEKTPESTLTRKDSAALLEKRTAKELDAMLTEHFSSSRSSTSVNNNNPQEEEALSGDPHAALNGLFHQAQSAH
jgi:hypothetical protein